MQMKCGLAEIPNLAHALGAVHEQGLTSATATNENPPNQPSGLIPQAAGVLEIKHSITYKMPGMRPSQGAGEMYMGAVDALEGEGKAGMAADIFHQAVGNQVPPRGTPSQQNAHFVVRHDLTPRFRRGDLVFHTCTWSAIKRPPMTCVGPAPELSRQRQYVSRGRLQCIAAAETGVGGRGAPAAAVGSGVRRRRRGQ